MRSVALLMLPLALAACGDKDKDDLAALDAQLTGNATDPAIRDALESPILIDPKLARQSNILSVKPADHPANGAVPLMAGPKPDDEDVQRLVGSKLLHAPEATEAKPCAKCAGSRLTLGALAREQGQRFAPRRPCNAKLAYGMEWAQRLPEAFPLYPAAQLTDAAGTQTGCAMRGVSFRVNAPMPALIDFYYTRAKRAGYSASHEIIDGGHVLGGTRPSDDGAYFLTFVTLPQGGTAVDMVVNNGLNSRYHRATEAFPAQ